MKNKILKLGITVLLLGVIVVAFYFVMNKSVSKEKNVVEFEISSGTNKIEIINQLSDDNIIRNRFAGYIYVFFHSNMNMQAGIYNIDTSDNMETIIKQISIGNTKRLADNIRITLKEGKTIRDLAKIIDANFENISYDEVIKKVKDKDYLASLIDEYWFLDNSILSDDLYYPLEGYLFPETYDFYMNSTVDNIIRQLLNQTDKKLTPYKNELESSNYSIHDILTIASIVEKEANTYEDREKVSQVIYKRLSKKMNLGMDTTTYYSVEKEMTEYLTKKDLNKVDAYNTRNINMIGLPAGAICNPSIDSIKAALNPSDSEYVFFYAVNGKDYFFETSDEFYQFQKNLKS